MTATLVGIILILIGFLILAVGILIYYSLLPVFYGIAGAAGGYRLGLAITGNSPTSPGLTEIVLALLGALIFAVAAYFLNRLSYIVACALILALLVLSVCYAFNFGNTITIILTVIGALVGAFLGATFYEPLIIVGTSFAGAALVMDGAHLLAPSINFLDRSNFNTSNGLVALGIWVVLGLIGIYIQFNQLEKWHESGRVSG
jgi:hypothetical protein